MKMEHRDEVARSESLRGYPSVAPRSAALICPGSSWNTAAQRAGEEVAGGVRRLRNEMDVPIDLRSSWRVDTFGRLFNMCLTCVGKLTRSARS